MGKEQQELNELDTIFLEEKDFWGKHGRVVFAPICRWDESRIFSKFGNAAIICPTPIHHQGYGVGYAVFVPC